MITAERLQEVSQWLAQQTGGADLQSQMRRAFPDLHLTFCSDDDVTLDEPAWSCDGYRLYLVDGRNHCLALTNDPNAASGLVVADCEEDD